MYSDKSLQILRKILKNLHNYLSDDKKLLEFYAGIFMPGFDTCLEDHRRWFKKLPPASDGTLNQRKIYNSLNYNKITGAP